MGINPPFSFNVAPSTIISMVPLRDIFAQWIRAPAFFRNTVLWCYGGYHFLQVANVPVFQDFLSSAFKTIHVFEVRHAVGDRDFIPNPPLDADLNGIIEQWNKSLVLDLSSKMAEEDLTQQLKKKFVQAIQTITDYPLKVSVASVLVAVFYGTDATKPCTLTFTPGVLQCEITPSGPTLRCGATPRGYGKKSKKVWRRDGGCSNQL